jgi:hypothetical protein
MLLHRIPAETAELVRTQDPVGTEAELVVDTIGLIELLDTVLYRPVAIPLLKPFSNVCADQL